MADIRSAAGQLLIMGFDANSLDEHLRGMLAEIQPGGVILFARNIESARQTHTLLEGCQQAITTPAFLCVDMEGGMVDRLKAVVYPAPAAADVFATADRLLFWEHGRVIGNECRALGFNTDFAPVLDLAYPASKNVLGSRAVSPDPKGTAIYAAHFLRGLAAARVIGCGKHFPGLGEARLDTHHALPTITKPWKKLWMEDLAPYRALRAKLPFVMVAHAAFPGVTKGATPASLSTKWIGEILRKTIGYRGLVVSDDLEMGGVLAAASIEDAAIQTLYAGADIYLVCHSQKHVASTYEAVVKECERDHRFAALVEERARRVLKYKKKVGRWLKQSPPPTAKKIAQLRSQMKKFEDAVHHRLAF